MYTSEDFGNTIRQLGTASWMSLLPFQDVVR